MASSSSSPPQKQRYEVFLSFRGDDTRFSFVSHLHFALQRRTIKTYFDETNLQTGQIISDALIEAIRESAIAIVVLSENYGSSTWCLNELREIVECKNKNKLTIYPIFYHVDPSDVRKQQNSFFDAFSNHEVNFKDKIELVNAWRDALTQVANLAGMHTRNNKNEASCIETIVHEIFWHLPIKLSHFKESLVGMKSRISDIKSLIDNNPDEVRFIGIWGMGGVGKTTTARAIFEECKSGFESSCFLQDVRQRKNKMEKLQQQLLSQVLKCKIERINNVVEGASMICETMCHKRVLLVIDDVDDIQQLNDLAVKGDWFGKGSRIIITTRDEHLLNVAHDKYVLNTLNDEEALLLFREHAFKSKHPEEKFKKLSREVLRYAGGLPLALKVLGDHLNRRKESVWLDTLSRLKRVPEQKIISMLQISFDSLNSLQQDIFLYIACFFRGLARVDVMDHLEDLGLHSEEGIDVLIQKSLIRESHENHSGKIGMHDLLQDMGHHIVRKRANSKVQKYSHLWLDEDIKNVLLYHMGSTEAQGITINSSFYDDAMQSKLLKEESFKNMNSLRFLHIKGVFHESNFSVHLPNGLRCLDWSFYPGKCLRIDPSIPMDLVHLEMHCSSIEITPDISLMPKLEVLDLSYSINLVDIHSSLGCHEKIKRINLPGCIKMKQFPTIIRTPREDKDNRFEILL